MEKETKQIKIYGKGEKAINIEIYKHYRNDIFKGYKLLVEATDNLWKEKIAMMLEKDELLDIKLFIMNLKKDLEFKRKNGDVVKGCFFIKTNNDTLIKLSNSKGKKIIIKIDKLDLIALDFYIDRLLQLALKDKYGIIVNKEYLYDYINNYIKFNNNNKNDDNNDNNDNNNDNKNFEIKYINLYNGKENINIIKVTKEIYNFIKEKKHLNLNENKKKEFIEKLKEINIKNGNKYFFLNEKNFNSITI